MAHYKREKYFPKETEKLKLQHAKGFSWHGSKVQLSLLLIGIFARSHQQQIFKPSIPEHSETNLWKIKSVNCSGRLKNPTELYLAEFCF